jgi:hypothetical protein
MVATIENEENAMNGTQVGLILGALLGLALILEGFGEMLIVALFSLIGWVVARVIQGDLDVGDLIDRTSRNRPDRPR